MLTKGFTLIELIMVIVILGILAIIAIPTYIDLQDEARQSAAAGIRGAIAAGAEIYRANQQANNISNDYPADWTDCLDASGVADVTDGGFTVIYVSTDGRATVTY